MILTGLDLDVLLRLQAQESQPLSRKRSRPPSAEGIQPKEEPEDLGEPTSQRQRTCESAQGQQSVGTLQSLEGSLSGAADANGQTSAPPAADTAVASALTDSTDIASSQAALPIQAGPIGPAIQQGAPTADAGTLSEMGGNDEAGSRLQDEGHQQSVGDPRGAGDASISEATGGMPGDGLDSSQRVEEHFQPSLPMQEMVVNFLLRMAFVIGGDRDHDLQVRPVTRDH